MDMSMARTVITIIDLPATRRYWMPFVNGLLRFRRHFSVWGLNYVGWAL